MTKLSASAASLFRVTFDDREIEQQSAGVIENDSGNRRQRQRLVTDARAKINNKLGSRHPGSPGDSA